MTSKFAKAATVGTVTDGANFDPVETRHSLPDDDLAVGAMHMTWALRMLVALPPHTDDARLPSVVQDACLESYFTNLRLLIEFFHRHSNPKDFHSTDYMPGFSPSTGMSAARWADMWTFASQNVAHLSRGRVPQPDDLVLNVAAAALELNAGLILNVADEFARALRDNGPYTALFRDGLDMARRIGADESEGPAPT